LHELKNRGKGKFSKECGVKTSTTNYHELDELHKYKGKVVREKYLIGKWVESKKI